MKAIGAASIPSLIPNRSYAIAHGALATIGSVTMTRFGLNHDRAADAKSTNPELVSLERFEISPPDHLPQTDVPARRSA
jgi:hypothetical protein